MSLTKDITDLRTKTGQHHTGRIRKLDIETAQETGIPFITEQDDELARRIVLG